MKRIFVVLSAALALLLFFGCAAAPPGTPTPAPAPAAGGTPGVSDAPDAADAAGAQLEEGIKDVAFEARYMKYTMGNASGFEPVVDVIADAAAQAAWAECLSAEELKAFEAHIAELNEAAPLYEGDRKLVAVSFEAGSGSIDIVVTGAAHADGALTLTLEKRIPEVGTMDMVCWTVLVALDVPAGAEVRAELVEVNV